MLCVISNARQAYKERVKHVCKDQFSRRILEQGKSVCEIICGMYKLDLLLTGDSLDIQTSVDHDENSRAKWDRSQLPPGIS